MLQKYRFNVLRGFILFELTPKQRIVLPVPPPALFLCPHCKIEHRVADILRAARPIGGGVDALVARCPGDGVLEFSVEDESIWLGYTYAAGALHFCAMEQATVPGLQIMSTAPLRLLLDGQSFEPG